jgi:hypothetical protein
MASQIGPLAYSGKKLEKSAIWGSRTVKNLKKKKIVLSLFSVPYDLFCPDLKKSLAKISQRPENRKDWSKLLMVLLLAPFLKGGEIQIRKFFSIVIG